MPTRCYSTRLRVVEVQTLRLIEVMQAEHFAAGPPSSNSPPSALCSWPTCSHSMRVVAVEARTLAVRESEREAARMLQAEFKQGLAPKGPCERARARELALAV